MKTQEQKADGSYVTITADFGRYSCVKDPVSSDAVVKYYRVRKAWKDAGSKLGAYTGV